MEAAFLSDIVVICGLSVAVVYICHRIKVPTIIAFLLTGVLAGPHGLGMVHSTHEVEVLAEMGVVLLLFTIGLEFSFSELAKMKRPMLLGGSVQVFTTIGLTLGAGVAMGLGLGTATFLGFMAALSSTAIVLKLLEQRGLMGSPQGRTSLAVLIYQDVAVVGMLLLAPLLATGGQAAGPAQEAGDGLWLFLKGLLVVAFLAAAAKWGVRRLLDATASRRDRELSVVTVAVVLLGVAWLTSWAGLSLALGAFVAGLMVAESQYGAQAVGSVLPMRDLFTSIFFVSVGMLLDVRFLADNPLLVLAITAGVLAAKTITGGLAALAVGYNARVALAVGLSLAQVGEFSLVLAQAGQGLGLISGQTFQMALAASVLTMIATPGMIWLGGRVALRPGPDRRAEAGDRAVAAASQEMSDHLVVVGYGVNGANVARAAAAAGIPYLVVEMNSTTVKREAAKGTPIFYGDAVNQAVLEHAGLERARGLVLTLADPIATRRVVAAARAAHPGLYIIARTRYLQEVEGLVGLGANEVVPEEYETSLEIFSRVLRRFGMAECEINRLRAQLRAEGYSLLRSPEAPAMAGLCGDLGGAQMATLLVNQGSPADGASLAGLELRKVHAVNVLAIAREGDTEVNPDPNRPMRAGDRLMVLARPQDLAAVEGLFATD